MAVGGVTTVQKTLSTTPASLALTELDATPGFEVIIYNPSATVVYIGGPTVTTANGIPIPATTLHPFRLPLAHKDTLWAVAASGTPTINILLLLA